MPPATAGRPAGSGPGRSGGAAPRSRAGAPGARHPWTPHAGPAPSCSRADGMRAGRPPRRSLSDDPSPQDCPARPDRVIEPHRDRLMANGFVPSWRRGQDSQPRKSDNRSLPSESRVSPEMVTSHVETLIERLTGIDKVRPDHDGDYPISYRSALYFVRVVQPERPVVQVFSVAVDDIPLTAALTRDLNEINSKLHFCRTFWVLGQVLVEAEHLGATLSEADFEVCLQCRRSHRCVCRLAS